MGWCKTEENLTKTNCYGEGNYIFKFSLSEDMLYISGRHLQAGKISIYPITYGLFVHPPLKPATKLGEVEEDL